MDPTPLENEAMRRLLAGFDLSLGRDAPASTMPEALQTVLSQGIARENDCFLFAANRDGARSAPESRFQDMTGYECFVNLVHVARHGEDDKESLAAALDFAAGTRRLLESLPEPRPEFRVILTVDTDSCSIRFHARRNGESWLADDLEKYEEAVAVLDAAGR
jgi:hypothetical protein